MGLPVRDQVKYWGIAAVVFFLVLVVLGDVMLPFVLGAAIAYCLDPIADRLENIGFSRVLATVTITLFAAVLFVLAALLVVPMLISQLVGLVETAPTLFARFSDFLTTKFPELLDSNSQLSQSIASVAETLQSKGGELLNSVLTSAAGLMNIVVLLVLVPVITFYLLLDWDRMVAEVEKLLPRDHAPAVGALARDINLTLSAFIRGQGTVCLILGTFYAIALMLVGLHFGLVIGATAGMLSFIPYVGALVGGALSIGYAAFQYWGSIEIVTGDTITYSTDWMRILLVVGIFAIGQFFEGNILTPNLVGGSIGLHPVWLIFSLSAFGSLFGFVGLLVAVPVSAAIGVIIRFALGRYQGSRLYKGVAEQSKD